MCVRVSMCVHVVLAVKMTVPMLQASASGSWLRCVCNSSIVTSHSHGMDGFENEHSI